MPILAHGQPLNSHDIEAHKKLGIDPGLLERAGVRRVDDSEARELLSVNGRHGDHQGTVTPYLHPILGHERGYRLRRDHPEFEGGRPKNKYVATAGRAFFYFAPDSAPLLVDRSVTVVLVESAKAVLAGTSAAIRAGRLLLFVATNGCWGFRGRIGKTENADGQRVDEVGINPDLDLIDLSDGRDVVLLPDGDASTNTSVAVARREFARELKRRGARVRFGDVPVETGINGPDDYLGRYGDAAFLALIDRAKSQDFVSTDKGAIIANNLDNIRLALSKLNHKVAFDDFTREVRVNGVALDDDALDRIWLAIDDTFHFRPSKEILRTVVAGEAHAARRHPVRQFLDGLTWDGIPRLDTWLIRLAGASDTPFVRAVSALPLIAAVRRVRQPGAKFDELLVLESEQGTLKSTALRTLCPRDEWFSDDLPLGVDSKLVIERTAGRWIIEAAELHGNRGRECEQLKAFLSRQTDGPVRLAYGRLPVTVPRQFVLIGTTNSRLGYLKDSTGARRFWPVRVGRFDVAALAAERDALWAEAAAREADGESIRLHPDLWAAAGSEQEGRRATDPWEELLEPLLEGDGVTTPQFVTVPAVWGALKLEANHLDNRHADRVTAIMQRHGFTKKTRRRISGENVRCWAREVEE